MSKLTLLSHEDKVDWTLLRRHHPYWYAFRAFVADEIHSMTAAYFVITDPQALAQIDEDRPGEFPLTVAHEMVLEVWAPARLLLEEFNEERGTAIGGWEFPHVALEQALAWIVEDDEDLEDLEDLEDDDINPKDQKE